MTAGRPAACLLGGDAGALPLRDASVQCVVTSPPYWGLRDYGVAGQLGLEATPGEYVARLVTVFREVRRVLRPDGTCWLNLGDSYATGAGRVGERPGGGTQGDAWAERGAMTAPNRMPLPGLKPKDLVGIPWRVAFALQADGWWLRADVIWAKPNPMPESITDRPTKAHEYLFLLTKAARYYYDAVSIQEDAMPEHASRYKYDFSGSKEGQDAAMPNGYTIHPEGARTYSGKRNRRTVWTIATEPYPEAHFATFPEKLVEPCILAGTSERGACPTCGAPWGRALEVESRPNRPTAGPGAKSPAADPWVNRASVGRDRRHRQALGWTPTCACAPAEPIPCRVFDPFAGSGTTVAVAERLGRVGIGLELKPAYLALARRRTVQAGLL